MQERDNAIKRAVQQEMAKEMEHQQQQRTRQGDAVANDGSALFLRHTNEK